MKLYDSIKNPLDKDETIQQLIDVYVASKGSQNGFYRALVHTTQKENVGKYYPVARDRFESLMFNKWKNSIIAMTKEEFLELYRRGSYGEDFIQMRQFLKHIPDVSTCDEVRTVLYSKNYTSSLQESLDKYYWNSLGQGSGWNHVCSRYVTAKKDPYPKVEHRLYLNTDSLDTYDMATYFVKKCDEHHIPYYFKFDDYGDRDDTLVIYSSSEDLEVYLTILREIKLEHPDLVARVSKPPLLTGNIDGWIGYGSEPQKLPNGSLTSFNDIRSELLFRVFEKVTLKWLTDHLSLKIKQEKDNRVMTFEELITERMVESIVESNADMAGSNARTHERFLRGEITYDIKDIGYTEADVRSPEFKNKLYSLLRPYLPSILDTFYKNGFTRDFEKNIPLKDGYVTVNVDILKRIIPEIAKVIPLIDKDFIETIRKTITKNASKYGIDPDKFCFDVHAYKKLEEAETEREQRTEQPSIDLTYLIEQLQLAKGAHDEAMILYWEKSLLSATPEGRAHLAFLESKIKDAQTADESVYWQNMLVTIAEAEINKFSQNNKKL